MVVAAALQVGGASACTVFVSPAEAVTVGKLLWLKDGKSLGFGRLVGGTQVLAAKVICEQLGPESAWQSMPSVLVTSGAPLG